MTKNLMPFLGIALTLASHPISGSAQDTTDGFTWNLATELSFVSTGGNASSSTLGLKTTLAGTGAANSVKLEVGGIRAETNRTARTANGTASSFTVSEVSTSELTAESYFGRGRYDRTFGSAFFFGGAGWDRNTFAGIQNRYALSTGVGRAWVDSDNSRFKTDVGVTYTIQKDVDPTPGADDGFGGWRVSVDAMRKLSETANFTSVLIVDNSLKDSEDFRADWLNSLSVSMNSALALKTSVQLLWDNLPSLVSVPLVTGGVPTGGDVLTPGEELDTVLTLTLVITL